jgi:DNA-binding response OmpR family regulator
VRGRTGCGPGTEPTRTAAALPTGAAIHNAFTSPLQRRNRGPAPALEDCAVYEDGSSRQRYRAGRLEIRPDEHAALVDGRPLRLTVRELQLLTELASNAERILSREELYEAVWGRSPRRSDRSLDVYVSRLRAKLGEALPELRLIHTHTGIGYRFSPDGF